MSAVFPIKSQKAKKRDRSRENFKKRWRTFVRSGFKVHQEYKADVYIVLRRNGKLYEFKSADGAWPLALDDIVRYFAP